MIHLHKRKKGYVVEWNYTLIYGPKYSPHLKCQEESYLRPDWCMHSHQWVMARYCVLNMIQWRGPLQDPPKSVPGI